MLPFTFFQLSFHWSHITCFWIQIQPALTWSLKGLPWCWKKIIFNFKKWSHIFSMTLKSRLTSQPCIHVRWLYISSNFVINLKFEDSNITQLYHIYDVFFKWCFPLFINGLFAMLGFFIGTLGFFICLHHKIQLVITFGDNWFENKTNGSHLGEIDSLFIKFWELGQFYERIRSWFLLIIKLC